MCREWVSESIGLKRLWNGRLHAATIFLADEYQSHETSYFPAKKYGSPVPLLLRQDPVFIIQNFFQTLSYFFSVDFRFHKTGEITYNEV